MAQTFTVLKGPEPFFLFFFLLSAGLHPRPKFALCPAFEASSFPVPSRHYNFDYPFFWPNFPNFLFEKALW